MKPRSWVVGLLKGYKRFVSPWLPKACRFEPTCSMYAMEAVESYGVGLGGWLALKRLLRCHPFSRGGFDPVPGPQATRVHDTGGHGRSLATKPGPRST